MDFLKGIYQWLTLGPHQWVSDNSKQWYCKVCFIFHDAHSDSSLCQGREEAIRNGRHPPAQVKIEKPEVGLKSSAIKINQFEAEEPFRKEKRSRGDEKKFDREQQRMREERKREKKEKKEKREEEFGRRRQKISKKDRQAEERNLSPEKSKKNQSQTIYQISAQEFKRSNKRQTRSSSQPLRQHSKTQKKIAGKEELKQQKLDVSASQALKAEMELYQCPITSEIIQDPYMTPCGHTFEGKAIREVIAKTRNCPICRAPCKQKMLFPNFLAKQQIDRFNNQCKELGIDPNSV